MAIAGVDLTTDDIRLLRAFVSTNDLWAIAAEFKRGYGDIRSDIERLCGSNYQTATDLLGGVDATAGTDAEPEPEFEALRVPAEYPSVGPGTGALIATYRAHRCDPCRYTGPADEHRCPTRPVVVQIREIGGA